MIEEPVGALEHMMNMIKKYGLGKLFQGTLVLVGFICIMYNAHNMPEIIYHAFNRQAEMKQESHDEAVITRRTIKPEIDVILKNALSTLDADRAFVVEMHNGTNNTAGLPFIYGEMTYEEVRPHISHVDEDYTSLNLSRFNFPLYMETKDVWYGDMKQLQEIDSKMAARLESNDVSYFAIITLHGVSNELGYFGFTFCNGKKPSDEKEVRHMLAVSAQKLSILLDLRKKTSPE